MSFKQVLIYAGVLAVAGLVVGVAAGWVGLIRADGAAAISVAERPFGWALVGVVPLALVAAAYVAAGSSQAAGSFARTGPLLGGLSAAAVIGAAAACALFLVAAMQIPAVFGQEDAEALMRANRANFGWTKAIVIAAATLVAALPATFVARKRAGRYLRGHR